MFIKILFVFPPYLNIVFFSVWLKLYNLLRFPLFGNQLVKHGPPPVCSTSTIRASGSRPFDQSCDHPTNPPARKPTWEPINCTS